MDGHNFSEEVTFHLDVNKEKELAMVSTQIILFQAKSRANTKLWRQYDFEKSEIEPIA